MNGGILVLYGTTEGQTRKIATFLADVFAAHGEGAALVDATASQANPQSFSSALIAASLHEGRYQSAVVDFARRNHDALNAMPTAFVSVSLSAASQDPEDLEGLSACVADFEQRTGWRPGEVHHVAGAFRFSQYDFLKRWAMKYVAYRRGQPTDASKDYELTDWEALRACAGDFLAGLKR